jgi:uncharacterized protein YbcV (DUF1398 family)
VDAERIGIARACLDAAYDGSLSFPDIIVRLMGAGFEGYSVDYRREAQTYYLPDGDSVELAMPQNPGLVSEVFDTAKVDALVRWAQANDRAYSYSAFCEKVKAAGCAGYLVSFVGRRVVYYGRTAETHVELFPQ